jgi:hypothetical protein
MTDIVWPKHGLLYRDDLEVVMGFVRYYVSQRQVLTEGQDWDAIGDAVATIEAVLEAMTAKEQANRPSRMVKRGS